MLDRRGGYQPINIAPADRFDDMATDSGMLSYVLENSKFSGNTTTWNSPGGDIPAVRVQDDPHPFAEIGRAEAVAVAQAAVRERDTIARDRDRLAVENAALRERMAHLEHKPLPLPDWPREECVDHLAARRRAEGADMPPQADEPADLSWLGLLAVMVSAGGVLWFLWRML